MQNDTQGAVYLQTNDADKNEDRRLRPRGEGSLSYLDTYETGGRGTGKPHLPSQSSVVLAGGGQWLLVANAGSGDVSLFAIEHGSLRLSTRLVRRFDADQHRRARAAGVRAQQWLGEHRRVHDRGREARAARGLEAPAERRRADGAQIAFSPDGRTLVVTERGTNSISAYAVDERAMRRDRRRSRPPARRRMASASRTAAH
jgi:6-phosphogluconolactonase (cycloisomerase 2 family)